MQSQPDFSAAKGRRWSLSREPVEEQSAAPETARSDDASGVLAQSIGDIPTTAAEYIASAVPIKSPARYESRWHMHVLMLWCHSNYKERCDMRILLAGRRPGCCRMARALSRTEATWRAALGAQIPARATSSSSRRAMASLRCLRSSSTPSGQSKSASWALPLNHLLHAIGTAGVRRVLRWDHAKLRGKR